MDIQEVPCEDCLILPICKSIIAEQKESISLTEPHFTDLRKLTEKCSLLHDYILVGYDNTGAKDGGPVVEIISNKRVKVVFRYFIHGIISIPYKYPDNGIPI